MNTFSGKKLPLFEIVVYLITTFSVCGKKKSIADAHRNFYKKHWKECFKEQLLG